MDLRESLGLPADASDEQVAEAVVALKTEIREARGAPEGWERVAEGEGVAVFERISENEKLTPPAAFEGQEVVGLNRQTLPDGSLRTSVRVQTAKGGTNERSARSKKR